MFGDIVVARRDKRRAPHPGARHPREKMVTQYRGGVPDEEQLEPVGAQLVLNCLGMCESRDSRSSNRTIVLRKNSIRSLTPFNSFGLTHEISAKGRCRSGNAHDHWFPTSGRGELGTDKTLPVLRRVHEFPYIGMEPGVRQEPQSWTG